MKVGIDKMGFYVPKYYLDMEDLAHARGVEVDKYKIGIGQHQTALISPLEDIVTMAIEAAYDIIQEDKDCIDTILLATESAVDFSKSAGNYVHKMLGLGTHVRILEVKQACYAATGALQLACDYVRIQPDKKVLVLSSDVAWYGFDTPGEATQGAGAIALLVSVNPRLAEVHKGTFVTEDLADFYRPTYSEIPIVDGKLSIRCYTSMLQQVDPGIDYVYTCFHLPFASMADKANKALQIPLSKEKVDITKRFGMMIGNIYNGSLFLSLLSVLVYAKEELSNQTIGMYSYGSGAIGEFFSVTIQEGFESVVDRTQLIEKIEHRQAVSFSSYEELMTLFASKERLENFVPTMKYLSDYNRFVLAKIDRGNRIYQAL
jgi:hydroxymethylglutaryl-CoA synthase